MAGAVDQLRAKSPDELRQELTGLRREHFNLRVQKAVQQLNKTSELRRVRRDIARALTVLREKEMAEFSQSGKALEFTHVVRPKADAESAEPAKTEAAKAAAETTAAASTAGALTVAAEAAESVEPAEAKAESGTAAESEFKPESKPEPEAESGPETESLKESK